MDKSKVTRFLAHPVYTKQKLKLILRTKISVGGDLIERLCGLNDGPVDRRAAGATRT